MLPIDLIKIIPNHIPSNIIDYYLSLKHTPTSNATVGHGDIQKIVDHRTTEWIPLDNNQIHNIKSNISLFYNQILKNYYKQSIKSIENPQFLKYSIGGKYDVHNDSEDWIDGKLTRVCNRDITVLLYMNEDFEGGELEFPELSLTIKPKRGMVVTFPSYFEFSHRVHPVLKGERYCLATWIETFYRIYNRN